MSTAASSPDLPPGYWVEEVTGAWMTLPWPGDPRLPPEDPSRLALLPPSLGGQVIGWCERWLVHHLTGQPWRFTRDQKLFWILWYAMTPQGRWLYRSGVKRGAKGTGKDPMAAAWALAELAGPVRFAGWDAHGRPVGERHRLSLVQIGANSEAQAADVLRVANAMVSRDLAIEYGVDPGSTRTQLEDGSRIELLSASPKSTEGDPATAVALNESHHMTGSSGGHKVADVARRNVGKSPEYVQARLIEYTNAHLQGGDSVAERSFDAWQKQVSGRTRRADILYDSREAPASTVLHDEASLLAGLAAAYHDASWADLERLRDEAQDLRTAPSDTIRYYLNGLAAAEDAWIDPKRFDDLARPGTVVADGDAVAMFLDCSKSSDATVLAAARVSDGHVLALGGWQRPHGDRGKVWLAPRPEVDATVRAASARYDVQWFGVDPSPARDDDTEALYWAGLVDEWHRDFRDTVLLWATPGRDGNAVSFDLRTGRPGAAERLRLFTAAAERTAAEIDDEATLTHDGDPMLRMHAHNARRRPNPWGVSLGKQTRDSGKLVDYAVAMVGARMGRRLLLNAGKTRRRKTGRAAFY